MFYKAFAHKIKNNCDLHHKLIENNCHAVFVVMEAPSVGQDAGEVI